MSRRPSLPLAAILGIAGLSLILLMATPAQKAGPGALAPIDPQRVQDQDTMTWADYRPIPGSNWADPSLKPERAFQLARRRDRLPRPALRHHPAQAVRPVRQSADRSGRARGRAPVLRRLLDEARAGQSRPDDQRLLDGAVAGQVRHHRSRVFGPYRMPKPHLGLRPERVRPERLDARTASRADGRMERDCDALWTAAVGKDIRKDYRRHPPHLRRLRRDRRVAGVRRDEVQLEGRHPAGVGQSRTRTSRAGSRPATSRGRGGWPARSSGASPRCARARTPAPSRTSSATSRSACRQQQQPVRAAVPPRRRRARGT